MNPGDRVDDEAVHDPVELRDDHPGLLGHARRKPQPLAQVDEGDDLPPEIDGAGHCGVRHGDRQDLGNHHDFLDLGDVDTVGPHLGLPSGAGSVQVKLDHLELVGSGIEQDPALITHVPS
ncbi:hypothetical protein D3C86_1838480 [compost metagenome]